VCVILNKLLGRSYRNSLGKLLVGYSLVLFYNLSRTTDIVIYRGELVLNTIIIKGKVRKR
jgi:hypothetical protein